MTGRQQTTKGVWLAKAPKVDDVCTLILDLEGSDGRERGEDDTNFERQSALFALAVADVLLINVWCHDIGREQGSGKPLMKTIFQVRAVPSGASNGVGQAADRSDMRPHASPPSGSGPQHHCVWRHSHAAATQRQVPS